jgi:glycosyltransferase involved in cell wall biosynthesis
MPSIPVQGMERSTLQAMRMVVERGAEVRFLVDAEWGKWVRPEVEAIGATWADGPFVFPSRFPRGPLEAWRLRGNRRRAAARIGEVAAEFRPDMVLTANLAYHVLAAPFLRGFRGLRVFRLPNPPDPTLRGARGLLHRRTWRRVVAPTTDLFVVNSEHSGRLLEATGARVRAVRLIRNCLAERPAPPSGAATAAARDTVLYLGRIRPEKGADRFVEAAERLIPDHPGVRFVLAGEHDWKNAFAEALMARVRAAGHGDRILFPGQVDDVRALLDRAVVHACPSVSVNESFPNVILEAKAAGVPTVGFPAGGIPEALEHGKDGWLCPEPTAEALAEGIRRLLADPAGAERMGAAARASLERFSRERASAAWAEVVASARRGPRP